MESLNGMIKSLDPKQDGIVVKSSISEELKSKWSLNITNLFIDSKAVQLRNEVQQLKESIKTDRNKLSSLDKTSFILPENYKEIKNEYSDLYSKYLDDRATLIKQMDNTTQNKFFSMNNAVINGKSSLIHERVEKIAVIERETGLADLRDEYKSNQIDLLNKYKISYNDRAIISQHLKYECAIERKESILESKTSLIGKIDEIKSLSYEYHNLKNQLNDKSLSFSEKSELSSRYNEIKKSLTNMIFRTVSDTTSTTVKVMGSFFKAMKAVVAVISDPKPSSILHAYDVIKGTAVNISVPLERIMMDIFFDDKSDKDDIIDEKERDREKDSIETDPHEIDLSKHIENELEAEKDKTDKQIKEDDQKIQEDMSDNEEENDSKDNEKGESNESEEVENESGEEKNDDDNDSDEDSESDSENEDNGEEYEDEQESDSEDEYENADLDSDDQESDEESDDDTEAETDSDNDNEDEEEITDNDIEDDNEEQVETETEVETDEDSDYESDIEEPGVDSEDIDDEKETGDKELDEQDTEDADSKEDSSEDTENDENDDNDENDESDEKDSDKEELENEESPETDSEKSDEDEETEEDSDSQTESEVTENDSSEDDDEDNSDDNNEIESNEDKEVSDDSDDVKSDEINNEAEDGSFNGIEGQEDIDLSTDTFEVEGTDNSYSSEDSNDVDSEEISIKDIVGTVDNIKDVVSGKQDIGDKAVSIAKSEITAMSKEILSETIGVTSPEIMAAEAAIKLGAGALILSDYVDDMKSKSTTSEVQPNTYSVDPANIPEQEVFESAIADEVHSFCDEASEATIYDASSDEIEIDSDDFIAEVSKDDGRYDMSQGNFDKSIDSYSSIEFTYSDIESDNESVYDNSIDTPNDDLNYIDVDMTPEVEIFDPEIATPASNPDWIDVIHDNTETLQDGITDWISDSMESIGISEAEFGEFCFAVDEIMESVGVKDALDGVSDFFLEMNDCWRDEMHLEMEKVREDLSDLGEGLDYAIEDMNENGILNSLWDAWKTGMGI